MYSVATVTLPNVSKLSHLLPLLLSGARCHQLSNHYTHLPPSLRAPAPHDTHLDSIIFLITSPTVYLSLPLVLFSGVIVSVSVFHVYTLLVFLVLFHVRLFIKLHLECFPKSLEWVPTSAEHLLAAFPSLCGPTHPKLSKLGLGRVIVWSDAALHHSPSWKNSPTTAWRCVVSLWKTNDSPTKRKQDGMAYRCIMLW